MQFIKTMSGQDLGRILKAFADKQVSGILEAKTPSTFYSIWLKEGKITYARSSESIGLADALITLGIKSNDELKQLLGKSDLATSLDDSNLDKILLEQNQVPSKIITYIRAFQIAETLFSIVEWDTVGYELKADAPSFPNIGVPQLLPTTYNWLEDIFEYADDWPRLRGRIGLPQQLFRQKQTKRAELDLSSDEEKVYQLVNGTRKLKELALWSGMNYFTAHRTLYQLLDMGAIDIVETEGFRKRVFLSKKMADKLEPILKLPGVINSFFVDRSGELICQDTGHKDLSKEFKTMAEVFTQTVQDFESNLPQDSDSGRMEQILVQRSDGQRDMLLISSSIILVIEAQNNANWGLLRLTGQRTLTSARMLLFAS